MCDSCAVNPSVKVCQYTEKEKLELDELFEHLRRFGNTRIQKKCQKCDLNDSNNNSSVHRYMPLSQFLENVLDITATIIEIMCTCGIERSQAERSNDVIISALLYFDEIPTFNGTMKKKIQKVIFINDLRKDVPLTGPYAYLTYVITKYIFKAFYYKQTVRYYNPAYFNQQHWEKAIKHVCDSYAKLASSKTCAHFKKVKKLVRKSIERFLERAKRRNKKFPKLKKQDQPLRTLGYAKNKLNLTLCPLCETMRESQPREQMETAEPTNNYINKFCDMDKWIQWLQSSPLSEPMDIGDKNIPCTAIEIKNELLAARRKARTLKTPDEINDYINSQMDPCNRCTLPFEQVLDLEPISCLHKIGDTDDESDIHRTRTWNQFAYDVAKDSDVCCKCSEKAPNITSVPCSKCKELGRETCYQMMANEDPPTIKPKKSFQRRKVQELIPKPFAVNVRNTYVIRRRLNENDTFSDDSKIKM